MNRCFCIFFCCIAISTTLFSQTDTLPNMERDISVSAGISYPSLPGDFKQYWKKGVNISGEFGYSFQPGSIGYSILVVELTFNNFSFDETGFRNSLDTSKQSLSLSGDPTKIFTAMMIYKGVFSTTKESIAPYFLLGVGYFYLSSGGITVPGDSTLQKAGDTQSSIAWSVGAGVDAPLTDRISVFLQGKFILGAT